MDTFEMALQGNGNEEVSHLSMEASNQRFTMDSVAQSSRTSPPKATIDSSPLQTAMDKNKESLKVKLLVRRSLNQLVEQGIMPSPKTSPAIYEQQRQLERAKTGDLLKAKIKQRPDRMELERRHILEHQEGNIDPSLAEKKRMLEKALLVDHLNSKISHRPGPLELIEKNILHADEPIERIVKEGLVNYTSTDEAVSPATTVRSPESMVCIEDDSLSSEGETQKTVPINVLFVTSPQSSLASSDASSIVGCSSMAIGNIKIIDTSAPNECASFIRTENCIKQEVPEQVSQNIAECNKKASSSSCYTSSRGEGKDKSKKKNKNKAISKTRSIKFHEYKGPANAQKNSSAHQNSGETNYQLIMKQQYLLEYLEEICKHPPVLPASSKMSFSATAKEKDSNSPTHGNESISVQKLPPDPATETLNKLKVFQLKRYCKKYNLPVSGSKSSLVERLKPFLHHMEKSPDFEGKSETNMDVSSSSSTVDLKSNETCEEDILKEQQKRIAELQRLLKKSQDELEQMKLNQLMAPMQQTVSARNVEPKVEPLDTGTYKSEEINITSLHADKMLSDMDIKITVRIDPDATSSSMPTKAESDFASNDILLNVIDPRNSLMESNNSEPWKTNELLVVAADENRLLSCGESSPHKVAVKYDSNTETLDKLLGQVQPGIPSLTDKLDHGYTHSSAELDNCSQGINMTKDINTNSIANADLHDPLILNDYNDVDLLDFHMHIDDACDTEFPISKPTDNSFPSLEVKQSECNSSENMDKTVFQSEMVTDNTSAVCERLGEKNIFNDFDGMRFVHNVPPYCDIFTMSRNGVNSEGLASASASKPYTKVDNMNDVNKNVTVPALITPISSLTAHQKHLGTFSSPEMSNDNCFEINKFEPISLESQQQNTPLNHSCMRILNVVDHDKIGDRFSFDEHAKNSSSTLLNNSCNNNTQTGHISPMDFDSLLSNIDLPITAPNCDRGMFNGNQDKAMYDLEQNNLLDYFNDDYGMQSDSLTCEINNTSY